MTLRKELDNATGGVLGKKALDALVAVVKKHTTEVKPTTSVHSVAEGPLLADDGEFEFVLTMRCAMTPDLMDPDFAGGEFTLKDAWDCVRNYNDMPSLSDAMQLYSVWWEWNMDPETAERQGDKSKYLIEGHILPGGTYTIEELEQSKAALAKMLEEKCPRNA